MPFFRQTGVFQPFLFLLASMALVALARRFHSRLGQGVILVGLGALVIFRPVQQAAAVFEAHLGIGRAVEWAYSQKITQPLLWVGLEDAARPETIAQLSDLDLFRQIPGWSAISLGSCSITIHRLDRLSKRRQLHLAESLCCG